MRVVRELRISLVHLWLLETVFNSVKAFVVKTVSIAACTLTPPEFLGFLLTCYPSYKILDWRNQL